VQTLTQRGGIGRSPTRSLILATLAALVIVTLAYRRAAFNRAHIDYRNSNFFVFWLAGKMVISGQNPYDAAEWTAGHDAYGVTWRPNDTFLYPLPLAFIVSPLALLPLATAYFAWVMASSLLVSVALWLLLAASTERRVRLLFLPLAILLLFFGPVYLTLQIGSIGALTLLLTVLSMLAWDRRLPWLAGLLLAATMFKPSQGATLLVLAGSWMLGRRDWKALAGTVGGIAALVVLGIIADPQWMAAFASSGETLFRQSLGAQATLWGGASVLCGKATGCTQIAGAISSALTLGACAVWLGRSRPSLSPHEAFNVIIPVAAISTVYFWSYDQILYVVPVAWIVSELLVRTHSYLPPLAFALVLVLVSVFALSAQASSGLDFWSAATTVLVLGAVAALGFRSATKTRAV
jgi:hypothetical protein